MKLLSLYLNLRERRKVRRCAEAVGKGHPDKIADKISDSILESLVKEIGVRETRFSGEILVSTNYVVIAGEGSTHPNVNFQEIGSKVLESLGYLPSQFKFVIDYKPQSVELSRLNTIHDWKSNDQGIVFGYATNMHPEYLPIEYVLSRDLSRAVYEIKKSGEWGWAKEDMKVLVVLEIEYDSAGEVSSIYLYSLTFSIQCSRECEQEELKKRLYSRVIYPVLSSYGITWDENTLWYINHSGSFYIGGLDADTGVTNRKQVVDSYGSISRCGGGGLSGKDLTKIDRLGAYYARWIAKNIVASGLAKEIELRITYSIALEEAVEYELIYSRGSELDSSRLGELIKVCFPTKLGEIFAYFTSEELRYSLLSEQLHFGEVIPDLPWERLNRISEIHEWNKRD